MKPPLTLSPLLVFLLAIAPLKAVELPSVFSDGMVFQRDAQVAIWGKARPRETVNVTFNGQDAETVSDANGNWKLRLAPMQASFEPKTMTIRDESSTVTISDVLIGEVWLCSGQSNMQLRISESGDGDLDALTAKSAKLRFFKLERTIAEQPAFTVKASWRASSPASASDFSAAGFHFGKLIQEALEMPVGLIEADWGATPAIAWTRPSVFHKHPQLTAKVEEWQRELAKYPEREAVWLKKLAEWRAAEGLPADAEVNPYRFPKAPKQPEYHPESPRRPGVLANGMIAPLAPFTLRGVIWYQGESDTDFHPSDYDERIALLFNDWREWFENPEMPVGIAQISAHQQPKSEPSDDPWPKLREAQRQFAHNDPFAGMAVTIDIGETNDIHPVDKVSVGRRLARWALADVYGKLKLRGGPELASADFQGNTVTLRFTEIGYGLRAKSGPKLGGFTLAGNDGVFHAAEADITAKDTVVVTSESVPEPVHVRYAWQTFPVGNNLSNNARLPASPFEARKP